MDSPFLYGIAMCQIGSVIRPITKKEESKMKIMRVGVDLAKRVFQVHAVDGRGGVVARKRLSRGQMTAYFSNLEPCLVGMEACGSAHHWARVLKAFGHEVRLVAPQFVPPYRKGGKNDGNDAEAICEAVGRPNMRFVAVKSEEQQAVLTLHRARALLIRERTALVNQLRGLLAEYGVVLEAGVSAVRRGVPEVLECEDGVLPWLARETFAELHERLLELDGRVAVYDRRLKTLAKEMEAAQRLMQMPGIGPVTASALVASVGDARQFKNGRQFAAWLGLVPRQHSSGGKIRQGRITKQGERYLRTLLVHGARARVCGSRRREDALSRWTRAVWARRGFNKATVALAARHARMVWAMLARGEDYRPLAEAPHH
jgi:transposase